jgi:hypothetical protein
MLMQTTDPAGADDLSGLTVAELARATKQEAEKFQRGEPSQDAFGVELFRRAVCDRDTAAWQAVGAQYRGLLLTWIKRHPASPLVHEDDDYWIHQAFTRFWQAVNTERIHHFTTLAALLSYLRMCTHSVLMDEVRARKSVTNTVLEADSGPVRDPASGDAPEHEYADAEDVSDLVVSRLSGQEVWRVIARELPAESERLVVYLSFAHYMTPGEIQCRHHDRFPTASDVYRVKRNALDRLRRSKAMRSLVA